VLPAINVGSGKDLTIRESAKQLPKWWVTKKFVQDTSKPDGTMRKIMISKIRNLGWQAATSLSDGVRLV
jgi:GDP-L-fucose synthase